MSWKGRAALCGTLLLLTTNQRCCSSIQGFLEGFLAQSGNMTPKPGQGFVVCVNTVLGDVCCAQACVLCAVLRKGHNFTSRLVSFAMAKEMDGGTAHLNRWDGFIYSIDDIVRFSAKPLAAS